MRTMRRPPNGEARTWLVRVWEESGGFGGRTGEWVFDSYAKAREFGKRARQAIGLTPEQTSARYPSAGIDITPITVYTTVDRALVRSWPFEELVGA
jgi:hypothetical protein